MPEIFNKYNKNNASAPLRQTRPLNGN